ncbi:hypothetical protein H6F93_11380 [Leptolyngbya sp. FACHB-671]|uniref:hypothetical protein n=1 Tax=Leptolyngbya sp. FACHB-671 TaxID=2692812 RepID=UPI0016867CF5|nr:hypothetical protein [Leptolyngbya sp. FACHB-671]MBD2068118.1 hypothetical protein [Leptolyngbya sp. FACHB-671]
MTTTYTRDQLTTREMTKPKLQNIAAGLEIEFEQSDTKAQLKDDEITCQCILLN